jgi:hypothetical protein
MIGHVSDQRSWVRRPHKGQILAGFETLMESEGDHGIDIVEYAHTDLEFIIAKAEGYGGVLSNSIPACLDRLLSF